MNKIIDEKRYRVTPLAVWICVLIPIANNFIVININNNNIYYIVSIILLFISSVFIFRKMNEHAFVLKALKYELIGMVILIIFTFISFFSSYNINIFKYLSKYIFMVSSTFFVVNEKNIIFRRFKNINNIAKYKYYIPLIAYIFINLMAMFAQYYENPIYNKYVLGTYYEVANGYRFGGLRYCGMFSWPNIFAYSTGGIYFLTYCLPVANWIRVLLFLLIISSKVRSVLIAILIIEVIMQIKFKKYINLKNIKKIIPILSGIILFIIYYFPKMLDSILITTSTYSYRSDTIGTSLKYIIEHNIFNVLFGAGLGRFSFYNIALEGSDVYVQKYLSRLEMLLGTSDTCFTILAEIGLIGTLILVSILVNLLKKPSKLNKLLIIYLLIIGYSTSAPLSYYGSFISVLIVFIYNMLETYKIET